MNLIDGRDLAKNIREELKKEIAASGKTPKLGVILVGEDSASRLYVDLKEKAATEVGIAMDIRRLPAATSDEELKNVIEAWNRDASVHGILIQLPLPDGHDTDAIIRAIDPKKDADGFHPANAENIPPLHEGILRLIASTGIDLRGTRATIIANSDVFSKPLERLLKKAGCFIAILSPDDLHAPTLRDSRILVTAVGRAKFLTREHIPPNAVVIDVGTNRLPDGTVVGDVHADSVNDLPGWLTPVPGGVGPMTIAMLLKNVVALATR